jgi:hypothetical protein
VSNQLATGLATRSRLLAEQLHELRSRVREAVAAELGRVVADAVRDLLTATLRGRPPDHSGTTDLRPGRSRADPWDDDPDDWLRDDEDEYRRYPDEPDERPPPSGPTPITTRPTSPWASALSVGVVATRLLLARGLRVWPCVGVGVAVSALALAGGQAVRAVFAAAATALDLVCLTQPYPD